VWLAGGRSAGGRSNIKTEGLAAKCDAGGIPLRSGHWTWKAYKEVVVKEGLRWHAVGSWRANVEHDF